MRSQPQQREISITLPGLARNVSGILLCPKNAKALLVLGHGAGAGMRHPFMEFIAEELATVDIGTLRYQFPYMEAQMKRPDSKPVLLATVRAAVHHARELKPSLPLLAGGKSMGGRMTSLAASEEEMPSVIGIVFIGFPLHPPGAPSTGRAAHLAAVSVPMLFLQGTRDKLADLPLLKPICASLGSMAHLHIVDGADHSFHMLKSSGRTDGEVRRELVEAVSRWIATIKGGIR